MGINGQFVFPMTMNGRLAIFLVLSSLLASQAGCAEQPIEAGRVLWGRDLDVALASSQASGKPVFALFQEIPGCVGCQQFGREVLSNRLLVEAIESEFTPLLIHNNKTGKDAEVLKRFGEPAWNYQVVRFLDNKASDIIPRKDQVWDIGGIAERMIATLKKVNRPAPGYLTVLASESFGGLKSAVFAMSCFWTGEMALGQIEGVIATEAGFMSGREVTAIRYDPRILPLPKLIVAAEKVKCADSVWVPESDKESVKSSQLEVAKIAGYRAAPASDQKKQISGTSADRLSLSMAQATKVNAWIRSDVNKAMSYLTPSQREALQ